MSTPEQMEAAMVAKLEEKTGKSLAAWIEIAKAAGHEKHGRIVGWLKREHGVTHGYANLIAHRMKGSAASASAGEDLVAAQYAGGKQELLPIYEAVIAAVRKFGGDVEIAPKKGYVSLRRKKQFALVQPSTKTRVDLGLNLKGTPPAGRLEASGSFNAMVTHRVRLEKAKDVDASVRGWLKRAYDAG